MECPATGPVLTTSRLAKWRIAATTGSGSGASFVARQRGAYLAAPPIETIIGLSLGRAIAHRRSGRTWAGVMVSLPL